MLLLPFLVVMAVAGTEIYFEFDDRATSVSASPGLFFCSAATEILTPTYTNNTLWCLGNHGFHQRVIHGRLVNARITLPAAPVAHFDSDAVRADLAEALLDSGFFVSAAGVTFAVDYKRDQLLNGLLTGLTFAFLVLTTLVVPWIRKQCVPSDGGGVYTAVGSTDKA